MFSLLNNAERLNFLQFVHTVGINGHFIKFIKFLLTQFVVFYLIVDIEVNSALMILFSLAIVQSWIIN